jgi:ParB-like nuclease domain
MSKPKDPTKPRVVRNRLIDSEAVRLSHLNRRGRKPIVLDALKSYRATLPPSRFKHLNIDEAYQRVRITGWVNDLIHTIKAGGTIPAPISIAERPDGALYIVDGQQRFWAASECETSLEATIYKVPDPRTDDYATEKKLFYILNRNRALSAIKRVGAWAGQVTTIIRRVVEAGGYPHPVDMNSPGATTYSAPNLVRGVVAVLAPAASNAFGGIDAVLRYSETLLATKDAQQRAQMFLLLVPRVFPHPAQARMLAVIALGRVAFQRWADGVTEVDPTTINRMRRMNVLTYAPTWSVKFLPLVEGAFAQRWPATPKKKNQK